MSISGSPGQWPEHESPDGPFTPGATLAPDLHDLPEAAEEDQSWLVSHRNILQSHLTTTNLKAAGATVAVGAVGYKYADQTIVLIVAAVFNLFHVDFFLLRLQNDDGSCCHRWQNFLEFIVVAWFAIGFVFAIHFVSTPQGQQQYHDSFDMFWSTFFGSASSSCVNYFSYSSNIKYFDNVVAAYPAQVFDNFYQTSFSISDHRAAFCKALTQSTNLLDISFRGGKPCSYCAEYDTPFAIANCVAPTVFK